jgi:hypothetical protein
MFAHCIVAKIVVDRFVATSYVVICAERLQKFVDN